MKELVGDLISGNARNHLVGKSLSSCFVSDRLKIKIPKHRTHRDMRIVSMATEGEG